MGFGDNEPPALRAHPFPATLQGLGGFRLLILTFVSWDVLKLSVSNAGQVQHIQIDATGESTDFVFRPTKSGHLYSFVAKGCARALDGSTDRCSPESEPLQALAATNTNSLRSFLTSSGVPVTSSLRASVHGLVPSLRTLMGLEA
jgi:hypothetical protein